MNRPSTPRPDPWDQFTFLWDHTDVNLVRDALKIVDRDEPEMFKIGRLQLLVSEWEAKNLSETTADGRGEEGDVLRQEQTTTTGASQSIQRSQQRQNEGLLEKVLSGEQGYVERQAQGVCQEKRRPTPSQATDSVLPQTSSQEETRSRRGRSC